MSDWRQHANCLGVDPELFFPTRGESQAEARAVCDGCGVRDECLEFALANGEKHGIWGGLSERERRVLRRARPKPKPIRWTWCQKCGKQFEWRGSTRPKFCSSACRSNAWAVARGTRAS